MKRVPLWLTIVPLLLGGLIYWQFWAGWRDRLRTDLAVAVPGEAVTIGGFPYRLEADVAHPAYRLDGPFRIDVTAARARVNRNPWQRDLSVVRTDHPVARLAVAALGGLTLDARAVSGVTSVRLTRGGIARLSTVLTGMTAATGLFAAPIAAKTFEVHLRETRARSNEAWSATPPQQAQVVLSGAGVRFGAGAPLSLDLDAGITATARLRDYAGWATGGTVEVRAATLTDASGEVARLTASAVPTGGTLRLTGTIATVCPRSVAAAIAGLASPAEWRLRNAVRLAIGGTPGAFTIGAPPTNAPSAVRAQLPPCPRLS